MMRYVGFQGSNVTGPPCVKVHAFESNSVVPIQVRAMGGQSGCQVEGLHYQLFFLYKPGAETPSANVLVGEINN